MQVTTLDSICSGLASGWYAGELRCSLCPAYALRPDTGLSGLGFGDRLNWAQPQVATRGVPHSQSQQVQNPPLSAVVQQPAW